MLSWNVEVRVVATDEGGSSFALIVLDMVDIWPVDDDDDDDLVPSGLLLILGVCCEGFL